MSYVLTPDEHNAIDLAGELFTLISKRVIGDGPTREADVNEMMFHIHAIQRAMMAQAAARQYPGRYRLLGEVLR